MKTVLIVDDNKDICDILGESFENKGFKVHKAYSVKDAFAKFKVFEVTNTKCDILVTDYKMPGDNGIVLADWCKRNSPQTKVVIVSAHIPSAEKARSTVPVMDKTVVKSDSAATDIIDYTTKFLREHKEKLRKQDSQDQAKKVRMATLLEQAKAISLRDQANQKVLEASARSRMDQFFVELFQSSSGPTRKALWRNIKLKAKMCRFVIDMHDLRKKWKLWKNQNQKKKR